MSDDLTNVPRRLRRYYRHGEPIPEGEGGRNDSNPVKEGENHEENEPWMNAPPARSTTEQKRGNARRENARMPVPSPSTSSANQHANSNPAPKQGLFSRILHRESKPVVTPMDHALGLHEKEKFVEQTPRGSQRALRHAPPVPSPSAASASPAASDIQKTLQELKSLAKTSASEDKPSVSLTSFHFTPAGEAPRAPEPHERVSQYPPEKSADNLSPRERAEQRRQGRGNAPAPAATNAPAARPASSKDAIENQPAHIRRRMGQVVESERMGRDEEPISRSASPSDEKDDEDFKSLFSDSKTKDVSKEKKKKKASADEDDISLDDDSDADLELFEDEK